MISTPSLLKRHWLEDHLSFTGPSLTLPVTPSDGHRSIPNKIFYTVGGLGLLPWAPGTWGSLAALVSWLALPPLSPVVSASAIGILFVFGVFSASKAAEESGDPDPQTVVVDEFVGQFISLSFVQHDIIQGLESFVLFRILDIFKPGPIRRVERWPGGWGIMADDALAGLFAGLIVRLVGVAMPSILH
jgi:phosphatidylglycerophosphatase A